MFRLLSLIKASLYDELVLLFIVGLPYCVNCWLGRLDVAFLLLWCYAWYVFAKLMFGNSVVFIVFSVIWVLDLLNPFYCVVIVDLMCLFTCFCLCCDLACNSVVVIYFVIMVVWVVAWLIVVGLVAVLLFVIFVCLFFCVYDLISGCLLFVVCCYCSLNLLLFVG